MMRALVLVLAGCSAVQAQSLIQKPLPAFPTGNQSVLTKSAEVHDGSEMGEETAGLAQHRSQFNSPTFITHEPGRPYSQLASYLNCSDWNPNVWNNYASERAAIARQISQHVDMTCSCFHCKQQLHSHACGGGCGECSIGCKPKLVNRYQAPISTLYGVPSDGCDATCKAKCTSGSGTVSRPCGCQRCQSAQSQNAPSMHPASAMYPMALPPQDRVASPMLSNPRSVVQAQNPQSKYQVNR